jgi:hypothetical protein
MRIVRSADAARLCAVQQALLAAQEPVQRLAKLAGLILIAAAADAKRTLTMRLQAPFAHLGNWLAPHARLVPRLPEEYFTRDPAAVRICNRAMDDVSVLERGTRRACWRSTHARPCCDAQLC